jgi:cobalamin synthase
MSGCGWVQLTALLQLSAGGFTGEPNCHTDSLETVQKGAQLWLTFVSLLYLLEVKTPLVSFCLLLASLVIFYLSRWILTLLLFFKKK